MKRAVPYVLTAIIVALIVCVVILFAKLIGDESAISRKADVAAGSAKSAQGSAREANGNATDAQRAADSNSYQLAQAQGALGLLRDQVAAMAKRLATDEAMLAQVAARAPVPGPPGPPGVAGVAGSRGPAGPPGAQGPPGRSTCNGRHC